MLEKTITLTSLAFMLAACGESEIDEKSYAKSYSCGQGEHSATVTTSDKTGKSRLYLNSADKALYYDEGPTGELKHQFIGEAEEFCLTGIIPR